MITEFRNFHEKKTYGDLCKKKIFIVIFYENYAYFIKFFIFLFILQLLLIRVDFQSKIRYC